MRVVDLGESIPYEDGMRVMRDAIARVDADGPVLLLLEHAPVLTITKRGRMTAFISPKEVIERDGIAVIETDRGGDVTFHGPGQIVGYPILRLGAASLGSDVVGYVHDLEAAVMRACQALGVQDAHAKAEKDADGNHLTGVWCRAPIVSSISCGLNDVQWADAKVCAIGVGITGGVVRHGFALNVSIDLEKYTRHVVPCGLTGRTATSLERVLPKTPSRARVIEALTRELDVLSGRHVEL
jgi:lipoyl(octanoyl) transferase